MKTIKVFIASSEELKIERLEFTDMLQQLNRILKPRGVEVEPVKWEYLDASMGPLHKQEEYNRELKRCEMCLVLYWTRFGEYTESELNTAYTELCAGRNPRKLYVYFKDAAQITPELQAFKESFATKYGHFFCRFENVDTLRLHFLLQFEAYQNKASEALLKVRDSRVEIDGQPLVELRQVPFAGNNAEYLQLLRDIERAQARVVKYPDEREFRQELHELTERRQTMERSLLDTAKLITRLSATASSARLAEAVRLFEQGDNRGADAVLNLVDIDRDAASNAARIRAAREVEAEAQRGLETNIEEYRLKIKTLQNAMAEGWVAAVAAVNDKAVAAARDLIAPAKFAELLRDYADFLLENKQHHAVGTLYDESLAIWRQLASEDAERFESDVAWTLSSLAVLHHDTQRYTQAETECGEALAIYRRLAQRNPRAFEPDVAETLNNLANLHCRTRCHAQSEEEFGEALAICRRLAERNPEVFEADVAWTLSSLAVLHHDTQRYTQAEAECGEALAIYRRLAQRNPEAFESDEAWTLNNLAVLHQDTQRYAEAENEYEEALAIRRRLAERNPDAFEPDVAATLYNLATLHHYTQCYVQAEEEYKEALAIYRGLAERNPDVFEPDVAKTLYNLAKLHRDIQHASQTKAELEETSEVHRGLAERNPETFESDMARTRNNLAILRHNNAQRHAETEKECGEALAIYRRLAQQNPEAFEPDVAEALSNLALLHSDTQCYAQAEAECGEALAIYRRLAEHTHRYDERIEEIEWQLQQLRYLQELRTE